MAAAAVLAGARSIAAIAEWVADAPQPVRAALGARRDAPDHFAVPAEATIRRTLARLDADALAGAIGAWLADRDRGRPRPAARRWRAVAVDGRPCAAPATHQTAASSTCSPRWITPPARCWPNARSTVPRGEVPAFQPLLDGLDLAGVVVTADALHTHADAAEFLVAGKQAHYLFTVKAAQVLPYSSWRRSQWVCSPSSWRPLGVRSSRP
jgi:hypothetical protein